MKTALIHFILISCFLTSYSQSYVKLRYDEKIDLSEKGSIIIGFDYDTRKGKIKQKGKYFKKSTYLEMFNLKVIGGQYQEKFGSILIHPITAKKKTTIL
jgi:hypothetical protein